MTDPSKRYQQSRQSSPKALDEQILSAARQQADLNQQKTGDNNRPSKYWMPGFAFACMCLIGITFVLNSNTSQLSDGPVIASETFVLDGSLSADESYLEVAPQAVSTVADVSQHKIASQEADISLEENIVADISQDNSPEAKVSDATASFYARPPASVNMDAEQSQRRSETPAQASNDDFDIDQQEHYALVANPQVRMASKEMSINEKRMLNSSGAADPKPTLVELAEVVPGLVLDIRYFTDNNFVGEPIDGYFAAKALMTEQAATALARVQEQALAQGLSLKVFDAYRPQRAVNHFARWAEDLDDQKTKSVYYPNVEKKRLFDEGYIARRSGHSRGSTLDLTLVNIETGEELDMGSPFDFFDPASWPFSQAVSEEAQANRLLLRSLMMEQGFVPYDAEWWHFTLENEPFPERYFDLPVE